MSNRSKPPKITPDMLLRAYAIGIFPMAEARNDPETFLPSPGRITDSHASGGLGVRVDSALYSGYKVPSNYDSLIAKLVVHGRTRNECLMRLRRALEEMVIGGIKTNIPLHHKLIAAPDFINGAYDIRWLEKFVAK